MVKCVFILRMVCFLSFLRRNIKQHTQLVKKVCDIKYYVKTYIAPLQYTYIHIVYIYRVFHDLWTLLEEVIS